MEKSVIVLMEAGSHWPVWLNCNAEATETLEQPLGDFGVGLFETAIERIREHAASLESIVLVCAPTPAPKGMRETLLEGLISTLEFHCGKAALVLVSDGDYGTREELAALALNLSGQLEASNSSLTVRFRAQPRSTRPPAPAY